MIDRHCHMLPGIDDGPATMHSPASGQDMLKFMKS